MTDEKQNNGLSSVDKLLEIPLDEVFAMFVNDLRKDVANVQSASHLLSENLGEKDRDEIVGIVQRSADGAINGLNLALAYLKARHDLENTDNQNSS